MHLIHKSVLFVSSIVNNENKQVNKLNLNNAHMAFKLLIQVKL